MELTIEKLIYGGDGLARLPADEKGRGKAVFVPFVLEGEKIAAQLLEEKPGFARAHIEKILESSSERTAPPCPYFQTCGGCHYQHTSYEHQLAVKAAILKENLRRLAKLELADLSVHPSSPWNYRNRTRFQVRTEPEFAIGYFKGSSHVLLAVEQCPISSPLINRALGAFWEVGRKGNFPSGLSEIEVFANSDDSALQVELYIHVPDAERNKGRLNTGAVNEQAARTLAEKIRSALPQTHSVYAFADIFVARPGPSVATEELIWSQIVDEFRYRTKHVSFRVSGGSFFQVNRFLVDDLVTLVTSNRSGDLALDLYAGVGLFSTALATSFRHTVAVESSHSSSADLKYNSPPNVKAVRSSVDEYLATKGARIRPDMVVVDPPRAGLGPRVSQALAQLAAPRLTYVSCDPATLARDLAQLIASGYRVEQAHLVDLFPQTYHIESVFQLIR